MARSPPASLRRRGPTREPKQRFTIICEGQNTEPAYFRALQATVQDALVLLVIEPAAGVPMTIAQRAVDLARQQRKDRRRRGGTDSYEKNDTIWAVFDRDKHPRFDEAVGLCKAHGVGVARSNPCFELWLILHRTDFDRPGTSKEIQQYLEGLCPEYDAAKDKRPDCVSLIAGIDAAEQRAERQLLAREDEGKPFGPPSTSMFILTRAIRLAAAQARKPVE